jgi:hypothetical protein
MACLVSQQHVPNLLAIRAVKPEWLVLLVTPGMKKRDKHTHLLKALAAGGQDYSANYEVVDVTDENSITAVSRALEQSLEKHPDDEWIVNLTGGTKPMSMGAYVFSKDKELKTLYIAESNQRQAVDLLCGPSTVLNHHVSTAEFLAGYGFDLLNPHALKRNENDARKWIGIAALLAANQDNGGLRRMLGRLHDLKENKIRDNKKAWEKEGLILEDDENVALNNAHLKTEIARAFSLKEKENLLVGALDKHAVEFLTGKWLEVFIWGLLLPFVDHGIWDLHLGVIAGGSGPGESNELDVSFMQDQSLCIVECKTGGQGYDPGANMTLYKIEAVKAGLMAIRMKTYLATTSPNVVDKGTGRIKPSVANRCKLYNCTIIHGEPLKEMAELFLNNDPSLHERVTATFHLNPQGWPGGERL